LDGPAERKAHRCAARPWQGRWRREEGLRSRPGGRGVSTLGGLLMAETSGVPISGIAACALGARDYAHEFAAYMINYFARFASKGWVMPIPLNFTVPFN
jgi:hypothetical protein